MKRKTLKYCAWRLCNNKFREGGPYCPYHMKTLKRPMMKQKQTENYYLSPAWIRFRNYKKKTNPFCDVCGKPTEVIPHKIPVKDGGELLSNTNTQALCHYHHRMAHTALNQVTKGLY